MAELTQIQIGNLLDQTLNPDGLIVHSATLQLDLLSSSSDFPFSLLSLLTGAANQGQKISAATYLKNLIRRNVYKEDGESASFGKEFREKLLQAVLQVEFPVLRVLVEAFRFVVDAEFVKKNSWPELVPQLRYAIQNSGVITGNASGEWLTLNALKALQALIKPFQYFLNPKVAKEPVPPQLELITADILMPLLAVFHIFAEKVSATKGSFGDETERALLIVCKCVYYAVRSYMPSVMAPLLPSFCSDLYVILDSLCLDGTLASGDDFQTRMKTGKRALLIFCVLVTRHRKYADKLMPNIVKCGLHIAKYSTNISKLDCLSERIISLSFDVISHVLETGPGWRLVSPHFSSLLDSAIFPALMMNTKDIVEWEEDSDEFMSKNLPSDLEEISGWREDLFTARKSSMNLLGVISMSKGPSSVSNGHSAASLKRRKGEKKGKNNRSSVGELLVVPFLSKFPIPNNPSASEATLVNNYYGVLMGYGALHDFLREQNPEYTATLIRNRVLPIYQVSEPLPYLLAAANWILGELSPCLPEDMLVDVYSALIRSLQMRDCADVPCYPVRASAAGAIMKLLDNDFPPSDWLPLLQVIVGRIGNNDEEMSMLFQLLISVMESGDERVAVHMPSVVSQLVDAIAKSMPLLADPEPWSQAIIQGFSALAVMAKCWQDLVPEEDEDNNLTGSWSSDQKTIATAFSILLQRAWLMPKETQDSDDNGPSQESCVDEASTLLWFILRSCSGSDDILELRIPELLSVWARMIGDWHSWEETEDLSIFDCIKEVVNLVRKFGMQNFFIAKMPSPPVPPVPQQSIIESISAFVCEAICQYPSATSRACACIHILLHLPSYSSETEDVRRSLVAAFSQSAGSRFKELIKPCFLWKSLLLAISSCYICYPEIVQTSLEKVEKGGFEVWVSAVNSITLDLFQPNASTESEIKLTVVTLAKVIEELSLKGSPSGSLLWECFSSLLAAIIRLKEILEENFEENKTEESGDEDEEEETDDDDDEDSDDEVHDETEEEFLERYAQAAAALENGTLVEEDETADYDEEPQLGLLEKLDQRAILQSLLERYHQNLVQKQYLSQQLVAKFLSAFPEYTMFFQ